MHSHVATEISRHVKMHVTIAARKLLLAVVTSVHVEAGLARECLLTFVTLERFVVQVNCNVTFKVCLRAERFAAICTTVDFTYVKM